MDLNKVMLIWRITTDLEIKKIQDTWKSVINFSLATNRAYKNKSWEKIEEAEFHRCVVFWSLADIIWQYASKWLKVYIEWRLRTRWWEDQSWNKKYTTEIIVDTFDFCENKSKSLLNNTDNSTSNQEEDEIPF